MKKLIGILVGAVAISCVAVAQNSAPAAKPAAAPAKTTAPAAPKAGEKLPMGMTPEQMQKMMDAGTPGAAHKALEAFNGKWNVTVKSWMNGLDSTPEESTGTAEFKMALGGRVQEQPFAGTVKGGLLEEIVQAAAIRAKHESSAVRRPNWGRVGL
jgi:hypothetical protein